MTAFADMHEMANRLSGGNSGNPQFPFMHKEPRVAGAACAAPIAGEVLSLWEFEGTPSHGAVPPGTAAVPDNTTQGGMKQNDPSGGRQLWNPATGAVCTSVGMLVPYDRLNHISGLSGIVTTAQTVSMTPTRYTNGNGNFIALEIYTALGVTGTTVTASYTNQAGVSGQVTQPVVIGATNRREAQRMIFLSLAAGDTGVQSVQSITVLATTGTAGNFGVVLGHWFNPLAIAGVGTGDERTFVDGTMQEWLTDACIAWYFRSMSTTSPNADMWAVLAER